MPRWNLYAQFTEGRVTDIIMPNEYGEMTAPCPVGLGWYAIHWPLNPHFTGESCLYHLLEVTFAHRTSQAAA